MNSKTIYLLLLVSLCVAGFIYWMNPFANQTPSRASQPAATQPDQGTREQEGTPVATATNTNKPPQAPITTPPVFQPPVTPRVQELRKDVVKPLREMRDDHDMVRMGDAMGELARMRTVEAANVLAELLFANKQEYFRIRHINGVRHTSFSYEVMGYLYRLLEGTPEPLNDAFHTDDDMPVFQDWWLRNKDNLVFRDPNKPVPMPWGMRGDGKPPVKKP